MTRSTKPASIGPSEKPAPRRVVGYVRLSRETEASSSPQKQRQIIEQYAAARRLGHSDAWELVGIVEDLDVSATKVALEDRVGLSRVRQMIRSGEVDAVVVWRLDRLARSVIDYGTLLREGVDVVSATESIDTTTVMGQAMVKILLIFAELESQTIAERVRSAIAYRVSQGDRWRGGRPPYGYRTEPHPDGNGRTLVVDAAEAAFIRKAADVVLDGGSLYSAMKYLDEAGAVPRKVSTARDPEKVEGVKWALSSVRAVLTGDAVLGRHTRHGQPLRDERGVIVAPWPAILPEADVERLRAILAPRALTERRRKASRLLSGVLVCGSCGARLRVNSRRSAGAHVESYGCRAKSDGRACAQPASVNADQVEAYLSGELLRVAGRMEIVERREVSRDVAGLAEIEEAIAHTTDAMRDPAADIVALVERLEALRSTRDELRSRPAEPVVEEIATGETYAERWERGSVDERRDLLTGALTGPVAVRPVGRGNRGIDPERVLAPWRWAVDAEEAHRAALADIAFQEVV